jgi:Leucine-rich repeat (LRR) protein
LRRQSTKQEDPELVERLKKYEEASDMGDIISSSVRSAASPQEDIPVVGEQDVSRSAWGSNGSQTSLSNAEVISDPPNIRISRNPDWEEREFASGHNDSARSQGSTGLPTQSSGMSVPTGSSRGSSRGSEARKTIAPESVSHLIPDQVGSMVLDRQRNMWVKKKSLAKKSRESFVHSEASDDPFADIPDLSVDLTLEMQNLKLGTANKEPSAQENLPRSASPASPSRPRSAASAQKLGPVAEATEHTIRSQHRNHNNLTQRPQTAPARSEELVEHEIGINDGRVKDRRRLTISFSSPIASVIQDVAEHGGVTAGDANLTGQAHEDQVADSSRRGRRIVSVHTESRSKSRGPLRHLSVRGHSLVARPVSRIDERDEEASPGQSSQEGVSGMELSIVGDLSVVGPDGDAGQQASVSWMLATPARGRDCPAVDMDGAPIIGQYVGMLSLSPLSDFTVHRADESLPLEVSYVHDGHHLVTGDRSKDRSKRVMSLSIRELVEKLAEVEPFEPYWEDMQELDLRSKGLGALHTLDEFCGQLVSLDVSRNNIRNLGGVPASVRHLKATDNQLSSLTAWNHLMNLQYIDVSNNGIGSLAPFKNLVHLRSLKADNNRITSLDGIKFHRGLQILRVRGNLIETLDLDGATMDQLTELDLKNNRIQHVANLAQLTALNSLNLEVNQLETFSVEQPMSSLRYLHLNDNKLSSLDLKSLPHLRLLHADRNRLVRIAGFSRARKIDSLSLREQRGDAPLDLPHLLSRAYEVRKLYLSGNLLSSAGFDPPTDLLNLQLLEMANCGLTGLPDHVGLAMPNLRVLNLNMNALHVQDLTPLRCVPRLKRVSLAGNRLAEAAGLVEIFAGWRYLREVDVRDNPVTQGFYAPPTIMRVVVPRAGKNNAEGEGQLDRDGDGIGGDAGGDGFALPDQDPERDAGYCGRLDMHTRMRRRLWEAMVGARCGRVRKLDGLPLSLSLVQQQKGNGQDGSAGELEQAAEGLVGADKEDPVWLALKEKGLLLPPAPTRTSTNPAREGDGEVAVAVAANSSARWPAEDSFA